MIREELEKKLEVYCKDNDTFYDFISENFPFSFKCEKELYFQLKQEFGQQFFLSYSRNSYLISNNAIIWDFRAEQAGMIVHFVDYDNYMYAKLKYA